MDVFLSRGLVTAILKGRAAHPVIRDGLTRLEITEAIKGRTSLNSSEGMRFSKHVDGFE